MEGIIFENREHAGKILAEKYDGPTDSLVVWGIARGGVPVGYQIAKILGGELDVVTARKLPIPWSPEMGFGAIAPDGSIALNEELLSRLRLSDDEIREIAERVLAEVNRREEIYRAGRTAVDISGKNVLITDDGLATGYTMIAAIEMAKRGEASTVNVAVPVSPADTARKIEPLVDRLIVLHLSWTYSFAVASFYSDFHDLSDQEVLEYLDRAGKSG